MRKHSKNNPYKFMCSSHDSLFKREPLFFPFKEVSLKEGIYADGINRHKVYESSQVAVSSFRDFACAFKLTRLKNCRVNTCKSDNVFMRTEVIDTTNFSKKSCASFSIDTFNRSDDFKIFNHQRLTERGKHLCNLIQSFHKMKEGRDLTFKYALFSDAYMAYRGFSSIDNIFSRHRELSAPGVTFKGFSDSFRSGNLDKPCRRELLKETKHGISEDITYRVKFRERRLKDSLDFIFNRCNEVTEGFSFSCDISKVSDVLRDGDLVDGIFVQQEELGNCEGVFLIRLGLSQRQLGEIRDQEGINDNSINSFGTEEREEIDMIAASGLHSNKHLRVVFAGRGDRLKEFRETSGIHLSCGRETDIAITTKTCNREGILGDINADKKIKHLSTSIRYNSGKAGEASLPILHGDEGSETQSTYHGYGRQGTDSFEGSMTQRKWSSPAFLFLMYTGKTHSYKFYNTNS